MKSEVEIRAQIKTYEAQLSKWGEMEKEKKDIHGRSLHPLIREQETWIEALKWVLS